MLKFNVFFMVLYIWFLLVLRIFVGCGVKVGEMIYMYRFKDFKVYLRGCILFGRFDINK